jgi:hypothetical protein
MALTFLQFLNEMSKSEKKSLESHLSQIVQHKLMIDHAPEAEKRDNTNGWHKEIAEHQTDIHNLITDHPGLKSTFSNKMGAAHVKGHELASSKYPGSIPSHVRYKPHEILKPETMKLMKPHHLQEK